MQEQRIRILDIAQELGLSTATVSNVIHGKTGKVSDETIRRVTALLEERQYIPSMAGVLLARNSSRIIGVFLNDHEKYQGHALEDFFISASLNHLSTQIEAAGQFMMVKKAKCAEEIIQFASMWNMDGIVVIGFCDSDYQHLRSHMRIPFVVYDGVCENPERILNITLDNYDGGWQVGEHFRALGHTRGLCLADNGMGVDWERFRGFCQGFAPGQVEWLQIPMAKAERWRFYREHLPLFRQVTAVFAVSDYYAIDLMEFLTEQGFSLPEDLSIAGFDDTPMCQMVHPTVTTVRQDSALRAKIAIETLGKLRSGQPVPGEVKLPVKLVIRGSTSIVHK